MNLSFPLSNLLAPLTFPLLRQSHHFTVSVVLPFLEHHIMGIVQHEEFLDWLISLCNMHLSSFHALIKLISFWHWIIFHCLGVTKFIYSFIY